MRKTILDLNYIQANKFLLGQGRYITLKIPDYYNFKELLLLISNKLSKKSIRQTELLQANRFEGVNHIIYNNKDGKYAWRKLELINPYLYVSLVNLITDQVSWDIICMRFKAFYNTTSIKCVSIPPLPDKNQTQEATQIKEWLDSVESEAVKLALSYEYLLETDISDCYGSIYTHSIAWALHGKKFSKRKRKFKDSLGNKIDCHLQAMSYGQTNGIPQGSVLMNLIAELVLAYIDNELFKKLKKNSEIKPDDYYILRYRDDYRIFVRKPHQGEIIIKTLSETLAELGMNLNTVKTKKSENIIIDSIKPDKLASFHGPKNIIIDENTLRKELLMIYELGIKFPNCGSVSQRLNKIDKEVDTRLFDEHKEEIVSILANIVFDNPRSIFIAMSLIAKAIKSLNHSKVKIILDKLFRKFSLLPNSGHLEIWLQRITIAHKINFNYKEKLCLKVNGKRIDLFNTDWILSVEIRKIIKKTQIINQKTIKNLDKIIIRKEVDIFAAIEY